MKHAALALYQIIGLGVGVVMLSYAASRILRREMTAREGIAWLVVWGAVAASALFPSPLVAFLKKITGFQSGVNALIFAAIGGLLWVVFYLLLRVDAQDRAITALVRDAALRGGAGEKNPVEKLAKKSKPARRAEPAATDEKFLFADGDLEEFAKIMDLPPGDAARAVELRKNAAAKK